MRQRRKHELSERCVTVVAVAVTLAVVAVAVSSVVAVAVCCLSSLSDLVCGWRPFML